jgi:hypothetical protein
MPSTPSPFVLRYLQKKLSYALLYRLEKINEADTPKSLTRCNVEIVDCVYFISFCIHNEHL